MTSLALASRRLGAGLMSFRTELAALALMIAAVGAALLLAFRAAAGDVPAEVQGAQVTQARAEALVAATSASPAAIRAVGDEAKLINASLPFSGSPILPARPFAIGGDGLDGSRALLCLTQAVYYEAGFEPIDGRRAVAQVVLNRMRHPAFPKSVCGVVYQGSRSPVCQFSFVCDGSLYRAPAASAWSEARKIAAAALAGYVERSVGSATHYHADYVAPRWAPMLHKITKLGAHIFYRWPGAWGLPAAFTGRYAGEAHDPMALRPALRSADAPLGGELAATAAVDSGPPVARAPNDVGGLLDTSKGWTLSIPDPRELDSAATRAIASQQAKPAAGAVAVAAGGVQVAAAQ